MDIFLAILGSFFILFSFFWAFLPGMFGLGNFKKNNSALANVMGSILWFILLLCHPITAYLLWSGVINHKEYVFIWLLLPLPLHFIFFSIFGRNLGT